MGAPAGLAVRIHCFHCHGPGSVSDLGTETPPSHVVGPKNNNFFFKLTLPCVATGHWTVTGQSVSLPFSRKQGTTEAREHRLVDLTVVRILLSVNQTLILLAGIITVVRGTPKRTLE